MLQRFNYAFAMKSSQKINLRMPSETISIMSRDLLNKLDKDKDYFKNQELIKQKAIEENERQRIFAMKNNEMNKENLVDIQLNTEFSQKVNGFKHQSYVPLVVGMSKKPVYPEIWVKRKNIPSTLKKLCRHIEFIKKKHIYDAMFNVAQTETKAARYFIKILRQASMLAVARGMNNDCLFVKHVRVGKQRRFRKIYYHAKGRSGKMKTDICQVQISLEERTSQDLFKMILEGKTPPGFAYKIRQDIQDAQFSTMRKYTMLTTPKGRQQQRLMVKRRAQKVRQEYIDKGVLINDYAVRTRIIEKESLELSQIYDQKIQNKKDIGYEERLQYYQAQQEENK